MFTLDHKLLTARAGAMVLAAAGTVAASALYGRARLLRWGASDEEIVGPLPGDDLIGEPDLSSTRAITVRRSPDVIWPWIAQLGQGRGRFYSYDFLENLVGCEIHSADRVPEWQHVQVGDEVRLAPQFPLRVALVEPGRALVLQEARHEVRRRTTSPGRSSCASSPTARRGCPPASATATTAGGLG